MYIEREALIDLIAKKLHKDYGGDGCWQFIQDIFKDITNLIKEFPVVDVAPVVHSHVVVEEKTFNFKPDEVWVTVMCGMCGKSLSTRSYNKVEWEEYMKERFNAKHGNYCPDCGAKLDVN